MKKILIVTSEPENYVPVELEKAGKNHDIEVTIALTENFSFSFLEGGESTVVYTNAETDEKFIIDKSDADGFNYCIPNIETI